ncbi:MAG: sorbosone dehydrogenase family protein [Candidatus Bathyarchaeia archaeon]
MKHETKQIHIFALFLSFPLACLIFSCPLVLGQTGNIYSVTTAFPFLTFNQPVGLTNAGDDTNRIFVVEQPGVVRVFQNSPSTAASKAFLDISDRVLYGGEQGLLGLAFHPNYKQNGYFYVDYVADNPRRTVIARYITSAADPDQADKSSEQVVLTVAQPFSNHKGGQLVFGSDGYLYIGMGDGGSEGDPLGNGQNLSTMLGKILRIDVDSPSAGRNYGIPPDNPFAGNTQGYREEIFAYGLRNPWRFSFDMATGQLWVGDVGQDRLEEVDIVRNGGNYGWNIMEGTQPYAGGNTAGLELPIWEYDHSLGNAIIGGYVYRGLTLQALTGQYVYGDYGSGRIWALTYNPPAAPTNTLLNASGLAISSFGLDEQGELYICAFDGKIHTLADGVIPEFPVAIAYAFLFGVALLLVALLARLKTMPSRLKPASR